MTTASTSLQVTAGARWNAGQAFKAQGESIQFPTLTELSAAVALTPIWYSGQTMRVLAEPPGVMRRWNGTHCREVLFPTGATYTLGSDTANVIATTNAPLGGSGAVGDVAYDQAAGLRYVKTGTSTWSTGVAVSPASAASSVPSNVRFLSLAGVPNDADLSFGSTTFGADGTAAIQAILDTASAVAPLTVYVDTHTSVTGLRIKSYTTLIFFEGCGFILRNNVDNWLLTNYNQNFSGIGNTNITLMGKGILNGNGFQGATRMQNKSTAAKGEITILFWVGTRDVTVDGLALINPSTFHALHFHNERTKYLNFILDAGVTPNLNTDGLDFIAYQEGVVIKNGWIRCHDDNIVFAPNGLNGPNRASYTTLDGNQNGIDVDGIFLAGGSLGLRIISSANSVSGTFRNFSGSTYSYYFITQNLFGSTYTLTAGPGKLTNILLENWDVKIAGVSAVADPAEGAIIIRSDVDRLVLKNVTRNDWGISGGCATVILDAGGNTNQIVKNLQFINYDRRNTNGDPGHDVYVKQGVIKKLNFHAVTSTRASEDASMLVKVLSTGSVESVNYNDVETSKVSALLDNAGGMSSVSAVNIRHRDVPATSKTFRSATTIADICLSNYTGLGQLSGTFTTQRGDGFGAIPVAPAGDTVVTFTTLSNLAETPASSGLWKPTDTVVGYGHSGLSALSIPASTAKRVYATFNAGATADGQGFNLFFRTTNQLLPASDTTASSYGMSISATGDFGVYVNGVYTSGSSLGIAALTSGTLVAIYRDATGALKLQKSSDNATTWTTVYNFAATVTVQLYVLTDVYYGGTTSIGSLNNPKAQ